MNQDVKEILYDEAALARRVAELGKAISQDYAGKDLLVVGVLKGAVVFFSDLIRAIETPLEMDFIAVSSYGRQTSTTGKVRFIKDLDVSVEGRHVLIVEDILDTGNTLKYLYDVMCSRKPASVKICALLDKPSRRTAEIDADYVGYVIPNAFVVGYGLDYAERYRNLPYIGVLKEEVYQ
ncbi:MAG: hypoxanthine phosphoribosyltransferase [Eubacteriales bacterium]|nr:hypoxanthine phosphoribosyltransferase [Eubacteriales bacterium]